MTARDPDRLIHAFLNEGESDLPDRTFDAVRRDIHRTRQRIVVGPWREPDMSKLFRVAIAAAAVVAIGVAWINFGPSPGRSVGGIATPSPAVSIAPSPSSAPSTPSSAEAMSSSGPVPPGRFTSGSTSGAPATTYTRLSLMVPVGWDVFELFLENNSGSNDANVGPAIAAWQISGTFVNPCTDHRLVTPAPGPGVDPLIAALAHQPGTTAGAPVNVTIDGHPGKSIDVTAPADVYKCGSDAFWMWAAPDGGHKDVVASELDRIYVIDVDGQRFTFSARIPPATSAADRAEIDRMIQSITIEPA